MRICLQETVKHSHKFSHGALLPSQVSLHQLHDFFSTFWFLFFSSNPLFFLYIYKIIQSVSSREDIIDGISLIRLNVKQEGL